MSPKGSMPKPSWTLRGNQARSGCRRRVFLSPWQCLLAHGQCRSGIGRLQIRHPPRSQASFSVQPAWPHSSITGRYDEAISDHTEALMLGRTVDVTRYYYRGGGVSSERRVARRNDYTMAIRLNARYALPYNGRCSPHPAPGRTPEAIDDFTKAIHLDLEDAGVYVNRADAYWEECDLENALADCAAALRLDPAVCSGLRHSRMRLRVQGGKLTRRLQTIRNP